jgi:hypothetical protein
MPTRPSDTTCSAKKLHLGNDFVTIIFNESNSHLPFPVIRAQFSLAQITVTPLAGERMRIAVRIADSKTCTHARTADAWVLMTASLGALQHVMWPPDIIVSAHVAAQTTRHIAICVNVSLQYPHDEHKILKLHLLTHRCSRCAIRLTEIVATSVLPTLGMSATCTCSDSLMREHGQVWRCTQHDCP